MAVQECVAMVLAGGQGSRLGVLTKKLAKPAVPFGGKYRIIDFTLSNCRNSGLNTVGVLTQYQPFALHAYIGTGSPWDLDRKDGGVFILPPYLKERGGEWYKGTANAIYQNADFIDQFAPRYVLVLSGDHIYKMDYSRLLTYHKEKEADATIAVITVPWEEASRFGIMNTAPDGRILEFEEKPKKPRSNLASMGVYVFTWAVLKRFLAEDDADSRSSHDFGKDVIPRLLRSGQRLWAYRFAGYWKDVGTVESLWEAHMDLLADTPPLDLYDPKWRIYSVNAIQPPHYVAPSARITRSLVSEGCRIEGEVDHAVLFPGVAVAEGAVVHDAVIMPHAQIGAGAVVARAVIGTGTVISAGCRIGEETMEQAGATGITVVGEHLVIPPGTVIVQGGSAAPDSAAAQVGHVS